MTFAIQNSRLSPYWAPNAPVDSAADRAGALLTGLLGFLCFMPYPSISIGNASAMQLGNVLTFLLLIAAAFIFPWRFRYAYLCPLIFAPLIVSVIKAGLLDSADLDICFKSLSWWGVSFLTIVAIQVYAPRYALPLLVGIAIATLVHAAVGMLQLYSFSNGEFPLLDLYVNQSFASVQENAFSIANYTQRPFGIFPEPSAMSSSLAPFVVLWVAEICGIVRFRQQPTRGQRILFASAAAAGTALIIMSRSGHTIGTLAALVMCGLIWVFKAKATPRTFAVAAGVFGVLLPLVLWWGIATMTDRIGGELRTPDGSWDDRSTSLIVGYSAWARGGLATIVFGLGAGLGADAVYRAAGFSSIWSVSLAYLYETGLVGTIAIAWVGMLMLGIWRAARFNVGFAAVALVWLFGITFITSYGQLLPIWVTLGWLFSWPSVCVSQAPQPAQESIASSPSSAAARRNPRNPAWTVRKLSEVGGDASPGD